MSADPDNEYFSDGLSEELLNLLAKIPELKVVARTSAFAFKNKDTDATEIARQLRVAHILEGSVRQSGDRLRITAQLIDASNGYHLWSNTWERTLTDVFAIQDEIAAAVVDSLRVTLLGKIPKAQRTDPEAYSLLLKSRVPARRFTKEGFEEASRLLIQALAIDPEVAQGWSELARNQVNQALWTEVKLEEGFARAQVSAQRALSLDPNDALAMVMLGAVEMSWNWDFVAAGEWFRKAREVAPGDATSLTGLAYLTRNFGRADAALELFQEAVDRDPLNMAALGNLASANTRAGRFDIAWSHIEAMKQIDPESAYITGRDRAIEYDQGNFEEALRLADQIDSPNNDVSRACALHSLGRFAEAQAELDGLQQRDAPHAFNVADVYACWGEEDMAFEWLELAYEEHDPNLITLRDSGYQILHDDPRWEALLQKLGLSDEHAEKLGL